MAAAEDGFPWAGRIQEQQESPRAAFKHFKLNQAEFPTGRDVTPESPGRLELEMSSANCEALGRSSRNAGAGLCSGQRLGWVSQCPQGSPCLCHQPESALIICKHGLDVSWWALVNVLQKPLLPRLSAAPGLLHRDRNEGNEGAVVWFPAEKKPINPFSQE